MTNLKRICLLMQGGSGWTGGIQYIKNIVSALATVRNAEQPFKIHLLCSGDITPEDLKDIEGQIDSLHWRQHEVDIGLFGNRLTTRVLSRILSTDHALAAFLRRTDIDFVFPHISTASSLEPYRSAAWIPDFQHKHRPEFSNAGDLLDRERVFETIVKRSAQIVVSSEDALNDFKHFYPDYAYKAYLLRFKVPIDEAWFNQDPIEIQRSYGLPDRFFLVCNQFWKHKGHATIFEALSLLKQRAIKPLVVCTGRLVDYRHPNYSDSLLQSISSLGVSEQVRLLGLLPRKHQVQLMRRCVAMLQPSLFEGWNTSVEEARAFGKRIILSDLAIHKEQNPPGALFFNKDSAEELATLMEQSWQQFQPGPDSSMEERAREQHKLEFKTFGHEFLKLALAS